MVARLKREEIDVLALHVDLVNVSSLLTPHFRRVSDFSRALQSFYFILRQWAQTARIAYIAVIEPVAVLDSAPPVGHVLGQSLSSDGMRRYHWAA